MKFNLYAVISVMLLAIVAAAAAYFYNACANRTSDEEITAIVSQLNQDWDVAFNAGQAQALTALYGNEASLLPAGAKQVTGTAAITTYWQELLAQGVTDHKLQLLEAGVSGDLAFQRGLWSAAAMNAAGERQQFSGNVHVLYRRQADGSWKAHTHIWN